MKITLKQLFKTLLHPSECNKHTGDKFLKYPMVFLPLKREGVIKKIIPGIYIGWKGGGESERSSGVTWPTHCQL